VKKPFYLALALLVAVSLVLLAVGQSHALSTQCWNCHTMHNSQGNLPMASVSWGGVADATPNLTLLRSTCAGCHTATGQDGIYQDPISGGGIPIVASISGYPGEDKVLAGGNFYYGSAAGAEPARAHNCEDATVIETMGPPGFATATKPTVYPGSATWGPMNWTSQTQDLTRLTCAGVYGCHGDRSPGMEDPLTALKGAHHGNDSLASASVCDGTTLGKSYRFLAGIKGAEQNLGNTGSWEYNVAPTKHNAYYGLDRTSTGADMTETISGLCAQCHGDFHSDAGIGTATPWLRHPTDIAMPVTGEFADYGTAYIPLVPLGYIAPTAADTVTETKPAPGIVLCLSCHRAHGSQHDDLLRWQYAEGDHAQLPSCRTCHTAK
jgi:predicted CXXCH cytochrome family protein